MELTPFLSRDLLMGDGRFSYVHLWDRRDGALVTQINRFATSAALSPDEAYVATTSFN
jgi:hypothetical protein